MKTKPSRRRQSKKNSRKASRKNDKKCMNQKVIKKSMKNRPKKLKSILVKSRKPKKSNKSVKFSFKKFSRKHTQTIEEKDKEIQRMNSQLSKIKTVLENLPSYRGVYTKKELTHAIEENMRLLYKIKTRIRELEYHKNKMRLKR
jgi:hypothetical protein